MALHEVFAYLGLVGKLVLLWPLVLIPVLTWWLLSPAKGIRLRVYLAASLAPVLLGGLDTIRWIQNFRAAETLGPVPAELLAAARAEVLFPLLAGLGLSLLFLAIGLVGESTGRAESNRPLPRTLFVGAFAILLGAMVATRAAASLAAPGGQAVWFSTYFGLVPGPVMWFVLLVLIFRMWKGLDRRFARTTPGRAVGFLFLPLFNLYWIFQAIWGWGRDWNRMNRELGRGGAPLSTKSLAALTFLTLLANGINIVESPLAAPPLSAYAILELLASLLTVVVVFGAPVLLAWKVCTAANCAPSAVAAGADAETATAAARAGRPAVPVLASSAVALALVVFFVAVGRARSLQGAAAGTTTVGSQSASAVPQAGDTRSTFPAPPAPGGWEEPADDDSWGGDGLVGREEEPTLRGVLVATKEEEIDQWLPASIEGGVVGGVEGGVFFTAPALLYKEPPVYPEVASKARIEGTVVLMAIVDTRGSVREVKVISGHPFLAGAATDAVKKWRYETAVVNGVKMGSHVTITIEFKID